jgi:predicted transcriptional regulator
MQDIKSEIYFSAEDEDLFNSARLLILFDALSNLSQDGVPIERIAYYDFFSAHPFLVIGKDETDLKLDLLYYGFESTTIGYISSSQRFSNRRERLKHFLAKLLMRDLIQLKNQDGLFLYSITEHGTTTSSQFKSLYMEAYKKSAAIIVSKLARLSDKKLSQNAREWLKAEPFIIDLYDF